MRNNRRIAARLIVVVSAALTGCGGGSEAAQTSAGGSGSAALAPSGAYESRMPDGTSIRLDFGRGDAMKIIMVEEGDTTAQDGQWIVNGDSILVEGADGVNLQLNWRGNALVTDFGGLTMTFTKI